MGCLFMKTLHYIADYITLVITFIKMC